MSEANKERLTGLQINNFPKDITEERVISFLKENAKKDLDSVNFQVTGTDRNNTNIIFFQACPQMK